MNNGEKTLKGRTLYIHPMTTSGARLLAAVYRSVGIDAKITPPSDTRTMELGNMFCSGEECLPEKITLGDYLKIIEKDGFNPSKTAFIMPSANGPCRFGQYAHFISAVFKKKDLDEIMIFSPSSEDGYSSISERSGTTFYRTAWIGLISSDILRKMLLKTRPYEKIKGSADKIYNESLERAEKILENQDIGFGKRHELLIEELINSRDRFRNVEAEYNKTRPLIAILGEIFCRHNRFANEEMIRKLEEHGAETWIADVGEWVFYTMWSKKDNLKRFGNIFTLDLVKEKIKEIVMKRDEHKLLKPFHDDFKGYEEPADTEVIVSYGQPYLPARGALGEMALSLGRAGYMHDKGVDGIVDISPFSCMNGIVSEAVYPSFSKDHNDIPCRVFFYDGVNLDLDRDIGIFMELVRGYMSKKIIERRYPFNFK